MHQKDFNVRMDATQLPKTNTNCYKALFLPSALLLIERKF